MSATSVVAQGRKEYKDEQLLARLIGAAVLLAIAVIVLPFVLDGAGSQREYEYAETLPVQPPRAAVEQSYSSRQPLPNPPKLSDVPVVTTEAPPEFKAPASPRQQAGSQIQAPAAARQSANEPATPVVSPGTGLVPQAIPLGYNIQVASFVREANAKKLIDRLTAEKLPAYVNQVKGKEQSILRVFVGPIASQIDALAIKNQVDNTYRVESILVTRN